MISQRILLINPTITSHRHARFPLAVLSLSAALDGKYASTIIDGNVDPDFISTAVRAVSDGSVCAAGVTVMGGPQLLSAIAVSKAIRERLPTVPIIWGGAFPTVCPDAALNSPYVDYAVRAQGEDTLIELLDALADGRGEALDAIPGREIGQSTAISDQDLSRIAHDGLSGRIGMSVSLHLLRSRDDVSRQDGVAHGRKTGAGSRVHEGPVRRERNPVL